MSEVQLGQLFLVSTPIGNLGDMSPRAIETLKTVDFICAEDTRHTQRLLKHFMISTKMISLHDHNESQRLDAMCQSIRQGQNIALVSDAGTPLISDPGFKLVRAIEFTGATIIPIPGPSAVTAALVASGLPTDQYTFCGFTPAKSSARVKWLAGIQSVTGTLVFFESKYRLIDSLKDMLEVFGGDTPGCIAREITKEYETFYRGTLQDLLAQIESMDKLLGEFVVLLSNRPDNFAASVELIDSEISLNITELVGLINKPPTQKELAALIAHKLSGSKQVWYKQLSQLNS